MSKIGSSLYSLNFIKDIMHFALGGAVLIGLLSSIELISCEPSPRVKLKNGELEGIYLKSRVGRPYSAFLGIPYANQLQRFKVAEAASAWTGIRDATKYGSYCVQFDPLKEGVDGNEDCLFLNVFTPKIIPERESLPVLVFIHGGAFQAGKSNDYGADNLMDEDIILVTLNYRVGPNGFLSYGDEILPGNLGLKDQVLALEWIQSNIDHFGGNPEAVTLAGQSAGGAAVGLHILSPLSRGLFHQAICSSSAGLNHWILTEQPEVETLKLAEHLNCPSSSSSEIKACLEGKTSTELYSPPLGASAMRKPEFVATVEPKRVSRPFLDATPSELYKNGEFAKVPLLITVNEDEGLLHHSAAVMRSPELQRELNEKWQETAPEWFHYSEPMYAKVKNKISSEILKFYFSNQVPIITAATYQNLTNLFSDSKFIYGSWETALAHARYKIPTYGAILSFKGISSTITRRLGVTAKGMTHYDDIQYIFTNSHFPNFNPHSDAFEASRRLVSVYTNFVKVGNPNIDQNKDWKPISSEELNSGIINWMKLKNRDQKIEQTLLKKRMKFWQKMYSYA